MPAADSDLFADLPRDAYRLPPAFVDELQTPALIVWLDRVRENVRRVLTLTGGAERWRPHLKTSKIPAVWAELLRAGVRHAKCATTREAAVFADVVATAGVDADLLVAYPHRGPALRRLGAIAAAAPRLRMSVLVEDPAVLAELPDRVDVFVDVDPGMHRTGVPLDDTATVAALAREAGARFRGLHCYDGHQHDPDLGRRRAAIFAGYERLVLLAERLAAGGAAAAELVTAGTPAFHHALAFPAFAAAPFVHRVSPGTVVYHDARTAIENPDLALVPAALVLTRVVSHPAADVATCDAGSKALAAEAGDPCAFVVGRRGLTAATPSEEHLPFRCAAGARPARGELLALVPLHVCPTVNLAEQAVLVDAGAPPRIVPVAARAHELR